MYHTTHAAKIQFNSHRKASNSHSKSRIQVQAPHQRSSSENPSIHTRNVQFFFTNPRNPHSKGPVQKESPQHVHCKETSSQLVLDPFGLPLTGALVFVRFHRRETETPDPVPAGCEPGPDRVAAQDEAPAAADVSHDKRQGRRPDPVEHQAEHQPWRRDAQNVRQARTRSS